MDPDFWIFFAVGVAAQLVDGALGMAYGVVSSTVLLALGVRMTDVSFKSWRIGLVGAVVCPLSGLVCASLLELVIPLNAIQRGQLFLFASLPPAVFCFIIAEAYQQEPEKVAAIVMLGNLAALAFVPLGLWLGM